MPLSLTALAIECDHITSLPQAQIALAAAIRDGKITLELAYAEISKAASLRYVVIEMHDGSRRRFSKALGDYQNNPCDEAQLRFLVAWALWIYASRYANERLGLFSDPYGALGFVTFQWLKRLWNSWR